MRINNANFAAVQVVVYDQHPAQNVECRLVARNSNGTVVASLAASSAGVGAFPQFLNFPALAAPAGGHYTLRCLVPPESAGNRSGIASVTTF